jgi:hypothetical protein
VGEVDDLLAGLVGGREHVGVDLGVGIEPRERLGVRPTEDVAEVAGLDARHVLHEPEEVGTGRYQRTADVVVRQAVELPQQGVARDLEVALQDGLRLRCRHPRSLAVRTAVGARSCVELLADDVVR